jgi:cell division protein FtsL
MFCSKKKKKKKTWKQYATGKENIPTDPCMIHEWEKNPFKKQRLQFSHGEKFFIYMLILT